MSHLPANVSENCKKQRKLVIFPLEIIANISELRVTKPLNERVCASPQSGNVKHLLSATLSEV
jgi:hypothetical protein